MPGPSQAGAVDRQAVDASRDAKPTAGARPEIAGRLRSVAKIVIIDIAAPLIVYSLLRSAGMSTVTALVLSGVFPALGVAIGVIQHRRLDVVGALVLAGVLAGTVLGLISHSARLVLMEGSVPTVIFGLACLGSLWTRRPLMFGFSLEFIGPDTAKGHEMISLWQYEGFRHIFRIITAVWGVGFLLEAPCGSPSSITPRPARPCPSPRSRRISGWASSWRGRLPTADTRGRRANG